MNLARPAATLILCRKLRASASKSQSDYEILMVQNANKSNTNVSECNRGPKYPNLSFYMTPHLRFNEQRKQSSFQALGYFLEELWIKKTTFQHSNMCRAARLQTQRMKSIHIQTQTTSNAKKYAIIT